MGSRSVAKIDRAEIGLHRNFTIQSAMWCRRLQLAVQYIVYVSINGFASMSKFILTFHQFSTPPELRKSPLELQIYSIPETFIVEAD